MSSPALQRDRAMLRAYTDQPEAMPAELKAKIEAGWGGEPVMLYGLLDLDEHLQQTERWVAMGERQLAIAEASGEVRYIDRTRITKVEEHPGLSATTLILVGPDAAQPALATLRYSYRQQNAVGAIAFVLKQALDGHRIHYEGNPDHLYADAVAKPNRDAQATVSQNQASVLRRLAGFAKPYWRNLALGLFGAIGLTAMMLVPPYLTRHIIDDVVTPATQGSITTDEALHQGWWLAGILLGTFLIREFFLWLRLNQLSILGEYIARDLRRTLYDHLHRLSVSFFSRHQTGSIISRVSSDTDRIWDFIAFGVAELLFGLTLMAGLGIILLYLDWQLGLILVLPMPLLFLLLWWMGRKLHRVFLRIWQRWSEMTSTVSDTMPGIRVVQAFDQSDYERARFHQRNDKVFEEARRVHQIWTSHWPMIYLGVNILIVVVWFLGIPRMLGVDGYRTMSTGTFVAFLFYMGMFVMPLEMFGYLTRMINRSVSSAQRVFEVLDTEPEVREVENPIEIRPLQGHIVFEDVTFGYDPVRQILKGISFEIQPGEMIGLVGPSGAGKTTVINLIARFFDTTTGTVRVDGHDIREVELGALRQQIGMVLQDPYLFHGSVLDNIRYGKPDATYDEVIGAARAANAHDFICKLPNGYDTIVGERGHTLSGGERQRVSIARAVLHNPRVLILDEATSSVDTETERKIQEAIDRLIHGRTVIAIAHRLSTLSRANRLFVMKDGKLVETGTHAELLQNPDGVYTKLHNIQRELHEMYAV